MNEKVENVKNNQKLENIKSHLKENKDRYITGVTCLTVGVLGTLAFTHKVEISQQAQSIQLFNWKPFSCIHQTFIHVPARGNRGMVVVHDQTGTPYGSIREAADALNISRRNLSLHLRGLLDSVNGQTFVSPGENLTEKVKIPA
jgi:hypothetical protein